MQPHCTLCHTHYTVQHHPTQPCAKHTCPLEMSVLARRRVEKGAAATVEMREAKKRRGRVPVPRLMAASSRKGWQMK